MQKILPIVESALTFLQLHLQFTRNYNKISVRKAFILQLTNIYFCDSLDSAGCRDLNRIPRFRADSVKSRHGGMPVYKFVYV
jgi:hypothetical protein